MCSMKTIFLFLCIAHDFVVSKQILYNSDAAVNFPLVKSCFHTCLHNSQKSTSFSQQSLSKKICDVSCSVKFCEHSKSITSSVTFNDSEKCSKLCEMKKVLHHHRVPCSMMPDKLDLQPTFQPLENFLIFSAEKAPESVHLHNDINKLQQEAMKHHRNKLCLNLCRRGNGGNLCKCDLAPF